MAVHNGPSHLPRVQNVFPIGLSLARQHHGPTRPGTPIGRGSGSREATESSRAQAQDPKIECSIATCPSRRIVSQAP